MPVTATKPIPFRMDHVVLSPTECALVARSRSERTIHAMEAAAYGKGAQAPAQNAFLESLKDIGTVMRENKELVNLAGGALKGAFDNNSADRFNEGRLSLYQQQLELEKQRLAREQANANNLVGLRLPQIYNPHAPPLPLPGQG